MFFIILLSLLNQFLPGVPVEREMMCCKMRENNMEESIAPCCIENWEKDCEDNGCGGKCGDPLCHCPISDIQKTVPPAVNKPIYTYSDIVNKASFYYLNGYFNVNHSVIWLPPKIS